MRIACGVLIAVVAGTAGMARGGTVLVLTQGPGGVGQHPTVLSELGSIAGVTVTERVNETSIPSDIGNFDQVWDLRSQTVPILGLTATLSGSDQAALGAYIGGGGRLLLAGEWSDVISGQIARNQSVTDFLGAHGGGSVTLTGTAGGNQGILTQSLTASALAAGFGPRANVEFSNSEFATSAGNGFLVTEGGTPGQGSVVGWDFGDIVGASNARMLAYFDSNLRLGTGNTPINDAAWIEDMWTFLDGGPVIPLPSAGALALVGLTVVGVRRRR